MNHGAGLSATQGQQQQAVVDILLWSLCDLDTSFYGVGVIWIHKNLQNYGEPSSLLAQHDFATKTTM
jgi:hypothetical protein